MDFSVIAQHTFNGLMLGVIYSMVALGFSLFFGVLDVVKFSHGDVLTAGAFAGLGSVMLAASMFAGSPFLAIVAGVVGAIAVSSSVGAVIGRFVVLPLRRAPPVNILLATLMAGTVLRECIRLGVPNGGNPKPVPALMPATPIGFGTFSVGLDSVVILVMGLALVVGVYLLIAKTPLGLTIRAVAQDGETAQLAGIDFNRIVIATFVLGSGLAAIAGCMVGLYYGEVTFNMGVLLGVIGFTAAVIGGLGSILGSVLGGFIFAGVQTFAAIALPFSGAYKDVVAFGVMIVLIAVFPTGLIAEKVSDRV